MPQPHHVVERIQAAAGGDSEAFAELFDHHVPEAWGLAWAVALDRQASVAALAEGFALALRTVRFQPERAGDFITDLYREIYQAAFLHGQAVEVDPEQVGTMDLGGFESAPGRHARPQEVQAFGGLPERWRAALWLEACGFETASAPKALNVAPETAQRLLATAEAAFRQRLALAAEEVPAVIGPAILALAPPIPTSGFGRAVRQWRGITLDQPTRWPAGLPARIGVGPWRPAVAACAALLALGAMGVGVLSDHHRVVSGYPTRVAAPAPSANVAVPVPSGLRLRHSPGVRHSHASMSGDHPTRSLDLAVDHDTATTGSRGSSGRSSNGPATTGAAAQVSQPARPVQPVRSTHPAHAAAPLVAPRTPAAAHSVAATSHSSNGAGQSNSHSAASHNQAPVAHADPPTTKADPPTAEIDQPAAQASTRAHGLGQTAPATLTVAPATTVAPTRTVLPRPEGQPDPPGQASAPSQPDPPGQASAPSQPDPPGQAVRQHADGPASASTSPLLTGTSPAPGNGHAFGQQAGAQGPPTVPAERTATASATPSTTTTTRTADTAG